MAAKKDSKSTKLVLKVVTGTDADGKALTASRTFGNVNPAISDDDLLAIGGKLGALQSHTIATVNRVDSASLVDEA
ncbi:MAG: DUF1659 domain-containing protein [Selenomonadaceae bacterium]|nr:DUF1659 domain-containing protein [Selenomonadaceae bacterium]